MILSFLKQFNNSSKYNNALKVVKEMFGVLDKQEQSDLINEMIYIQEDK